MTAIKIIAGLGNPGTEYEHTRHNMGFDLLDLISREFGIRLSPAAKYFGLLGQGSIGGSDVRLLCPTTYMNNSGQSLGALCNFFKIKPEEVLVVHDDLDLQPGQLKLKLGGGHAGHNGLKSIIAHFGNNPNFYRLRMGIGHPGDRSAVINYVLGRPAPADKSLIENAMQWALKVTPSLIKDGPEKAMNRINSYKPDSKE